MNRIPLPSYGVLFFGYSVLLKARVLAAVKKAEAAVARFMRKGLGSGEKPVGKKGKKEDGSRGGRARKRV